MTYKPSQKYGLGRRNSHKIHTQSESDHLQSNLQDLDDTTDSTEIGIAKQPILIIFNPKILQISAEELNARNIWTKKLTGLQYQMSRLDIKLQQFSLWNEPNGFQRFSHLLRNIKSSLDKGLIVPSFHN